MTNNFLKNFLTYAEGCETPELYDLWSAVATLSSVVSRRVWINQGYYTIYPNLYIVLVGAPGGRKTTAMNMCKDMLMELGNIPFAATCMTKEALCRYMATQCTRSFPIPNKPNAEPKIYTPITMCLTELSHFLGTNQAHMIDFLTTIYDQEIYDAKTKNKGDDIIPGPYLTVLACTTPSNITRYLKEDVISGGFSRRALFAFELDDGEAIPFPTVTPTAAKAWEDCIKWAKGLEEVAGEFEWTAEATSWYGPWYTKLFNSLRTHTDIRTRGYFKSKHIQLLKVAMLIALSETTELKLKKVHLEVGLELLDKLEKNLTRVFEGMGRNELAPIAARIVEMLEMVGSPISEKKVIAEFYKDADTREMYGIVAHLVNSGKVLAIDERDPKTKAVIRRLLSTPQIGQEYLRLREKAKGLPEQSTDGDTSASTDPPQTPS
jgi:hypothetical protein